MGRLLAPSLADVLRSAISIFFRLVGGFKSQVMGKGSPNQSIRCSALPDLKILNCRIRLTKQTKDGCVLDAFVVEICGSIHVPSDMHHTSVQILITDVTNRIRKAKPVQARVKRWQMQDSPVFCYKAALSKLPRADSTLSDWTTVAQIALDWLMFPHKGKRNLRFSTSILCSRSGKELACATCTFTYENPAFGYIDLQEDTQRAKTLAVTLAFAVCAADKRLFDCELEVIRNWARSNIGASQASNRTRRELEKALNKTVRFFRDGNQLDTYKICKEIVEIAPLAERYDILALCLHVAQAKGVASVEELALLRNLANWLEVDTNRFRAMIQKILPVSMHEVEDVEVIFGITSDMSKEEARQHLNQEYRKWNARVTNSDTEIKTEADRMLNFIAETRSQYVG